MIAAEQLQFDLDAPTPRRPSRRPRLEDAALIDRGNAVRELIRRREIDPWIGLAIVCWPGCEETLS